MAIRIKYILFISIIHMAALVMSFFIFREHKILFIISEVLIFVSLSLSWSLYKDLIQPIEMLSGGATAIRDRDFGVKLIPTGSKEMDELVDVYNAMIDQLRRERTLQQEQHFFLDKLLETAPVGAVILDYDGHIDSINPKGAAILGLSSANREKPVLPSDHPFWTAIGLLEPGGSAVLQMESVKKFKIGKAQFIDRGFARSFVMIEDLTNELLEAEKKAYGKVIRMMAHEVNNSIGAVNSILDTARQMENDPALAQALDVAIGRNERLSLFMRRFADVIRLPEPRRERLDLHDLLRKTATLMEYGAAPRKVSIHLELADAPLFIDADVQQMEQVLINVIKNAIEAVDTQGAVTIRTIASPASLRIEDTGKGIAPDVAPMLFSPFFTNKNSGQGVGLTLVREILTQHRFAFSLLNNREGGAVFEIVF